MDELSEYRKVFLPELNCFGYEIELNLTAKFTETGEDAMLYVLKMLSTDDYANIKRTAIEKENYALLAMMKEIEEGNL